MTSSLSVGDVIDGRYEVRAALGESPAHVAYRAVDREVEVEVALWWMRTELFPDQAKQSSFVGAVVDMREVKHANLRRMFDAGRGHGYLYATAQLETEGGALLRPGDGRIAQEADLLHYAASVAGALEAGQEAGHVHGRLVASDVVHVAGLIKVGGMGLYRDVDPGAATRLWQVEERYLSPEVRGGGMATPASDVYSLARLLAELATGQAPVETEELIDLVEQHRPELATALETAMSMAPHRRPDSPVSLLDEVRALLIDDHVPTGETRALPDSRAQSDVILLTKEARGAGDGASARGKHSRGTARSGPHDKTMLDGRPVTTNDGSAVAGAGKTIPDAAGVPALRAADLFAAQDFGPNDEETIDEGAPRPSPAGAAPMLDPEQTMEDPRPRMPEISPAQMVRDGMAPAPIPSAPAGQGLPKRRSDPSIRFVSKKPKTEPAVKNTMPRVPVIDRPDMQPVLRPISSISSSGSHPPGSLGRYAPPRQVAAPPAKPSRARLSIYLAVGAVALAVTAVAVWFFALRSSGDSAREETPKPGAADVAPRLAPTSTPLAESGKSAKPAKPEAPAKAPGTLCPRQMVMVGTDARFCIDLYESPGKGRMPETGVPLAQAETTCRSRGARLCTEPEWDSACRGDGDSSYPYGSTYRRGLCNTDPSRAGEVAVAGEFAGCRSAAGVFDMSGNVAEWVAGGSVKGGSALDRADGRCSRKRRVRPSPGQGFSDVGFRCCTTVSASEP